MARLNAHARAVICEAGLTPGEYARRWDEFAGYEPSARWGGDVCGCPDDRCDGYHHERGAECGCLVRTLEEVTS
jgi:hypothetical protein